MRSLKKLNRRGHAEIFKEIFTVDRVEPHFFGDPGEQAWAASWISKKYFNIALNPFAGERWPSKELQIPELRKLLERLEITSILVYSIPDAFPEVQAARFR